MSKRSRSVFARRMNLQRSRVRRFFRFVQTGAGVCLLGVTAAALAQDPPDAGSLLRQQEQLEQKVPQRFPEPEASEVVKPALQGIEGAGVLVREIRFSGATDLVPVAALRPLVEDAVGRELDFAGLQALADKVTEYLRGKGYLLARAYLPRQDVTEGVIEIAILKGRLDGAAGEGGGWWIALAEGARIDADRLGAIAETAAPSGEAVRRDAVERALLLMNDLPGVSAKSRIEPGATGGSTRIVVAAEQGPLFTGNAWADNYGNRSTGEGRLNAVLNLNDPSGRGDHASLAITGSEGIRMGRLGYDFPLGVGGLRASLGYTNMHYDVVEGTGVAPGLEGQSNILRADLTYPFIRSRPLNLHGSLTYDHKALKDDSLVGTLRNKRVDAAILALNGDSLDAWLGGGLNTWSIGLTAGDLDLSRVAADEAADAASLRTRGRYQKVSYSLSRLQRLPASFTLSGHLSGQWAGKNLDSSEQFILGGPGGVRAYPVGEAPGDEGWLASVELRYDWPGGTPLGTLQLAAFIDTGGIRQHEDPGALTIATATGKNRYQLSGAGLGVSLGRTGSHSLRLVWAHTLGDNDGRTAAGNNADGKGDNNRFWLQGIAWF